VKSFGCFANRPLNDAVAGSEDLAIAASRSLTVRAIALWPVVSMLATCSGSSGRDHPFADSARKI
jgi:hypothetical protein